MSDETKHTPGPWRVESGTVYDHHGKPIARMDREPGNGTRPIERDANARLCAKAPAMEEALLAIIDDAPEEEPDYDDWGGDTERAERWGSEWEHWRLAQIARAALQEGSGRQPTPASS